MKMNGSHVMSVGQERLWEMLNDPDVLTVVTPGCERLEKVGDDEYEAFLKLGVAAVKGSYEGRIWLTDKRPPYEYMLHIETSGAPGFVNGQAHFTLEQVDDSQTRVTFDGEAQIGGLIAGVGQRMLQGVGKFLVGQFFKALDKEVKRRAA